MGLAEKRTMMAVKEKVIDGLVGEMNAKTGMKVEISTEGGLSLIENQSYENVSTGVTRLLKDGVFTPIMKIAADNFGKTALRDKFDELRVEFTDNPYLSDFLFFDGRSIVIKKHPVLNTDITSMDQLSRMITKEVEAKL